MKEILNQKLANPSQTPYSKGGDIFMEGKPDMPPNLQPSNLEHAEKIPGGQKQSVSVERQTKAREAWERNYGGSLPKEVGERGIIEHLIREGKPPIAGGTQQPGEQTPPASPVGGPEEPGNGGNEEDISKDITDPKLAEIWNRINRAVKDAGGRQPINPEFISSQINEIRDLLDRKEVDVGEAQAVKNSLYELLAEKSRDYDSYRIRMQEIKEMDDGDDRKTAVMDLLRQMSPYANSLEPEFVREVIKDKDALDYLVNRIVAQPLDAEQSDYRLSFYGGINLDQIKDALKTKAGTGNQEAKDSYQRVLYVSESAQLFHTMNLQIITGNLEQFVNGARAITPEQLQIMQDIPGVVQIMRLFDAEIFRVLNRDTVIDNKNFDEIMGLDRDKDTGKIKGWKLEGGTVEQKFRDIIKSKAVDELRGLEDWQIKWAFNVGKIMGNLSLRTAEQISLSKVPDNPDKRYASIPQESAARLMNWLGWTGLRFNMAEPRGGILLTRMASKLFQKDRGLQGFGETKIKNIGWQDIEDFELAGMFGVTGIWSSWRQSLMILNHAPSGNKVLEEDNRIKTIGEFLSEVGKFKLRSGQDPNKLLGKSEFVKGLGLRGRKLKEALDTESAKRLEEVFLKDDGELNNEVFNNAMGLILKHGSINGSEKDLPVLRKAKEKIRAAIWRRVAEDNPLAIIPYLQNTTVKTGKIVEGKEETIPITLTGFGTAEWDKFTDNMSTLHEIRMQKIGKGDNVGLRQIIESEKSRDGGIELSEYESHLLDEIRLKGKDLSSDLANVRFPNNPFMNDVIFERANYSEAGAEFYRRRAGGDLSSFYSAGNEFAKLMMNPGGTPPEEAMKIMLAVIEAIGSPLGTDAGQDRAAQFLEAYLTFISKGSYIGVDMEKGDIKNDPLSEFQRWIEKDNVVSGIKSQMRRPTSLAQMISGMNAPSVDEVGMRTILDEMLKNGLTRKLSLDENGVTKYTDLDERIRKKVKAGLLGLFLAFFRDVPKIFLAGAITELTQQSIKENK